jgi:hypothetical protein
MRGLLREPLLHFLLLGGALFLVFGQVSRDVVETESTDEIVVDAAQVERLAVRWERTWRRPPTAHELQGLIEEHLREEVYYREALALGLDRGDTIVRRRLAQKVEFLQDDLAAATDPTDEELEAYWREHPDAFRRDALVSFRQIYLSPDRGETLEADARELLAQLRVADGEADVEQLGDRSLLPQRLERVTEREVASRFGGSFAPALASHPLRAWSGPIESGFGQHLVWIEERTEGRVSPFEEVRDAVLREWRFAKRAAAREAFYQELRGRYEITVEQPDETTDTSR